MTSGTQSKTLLHRLCFALLVLLIWPCLGRAAELLPDVIVRIKPSIVVVGSYQATRSPPFMMHGTGFVVGNGSLIATNAHVVPEVLDAINGERIVVQLASGTGAGSLRQVKLRQRDAAYDIALLELEGPSLPALTLAQDSAAIREGQSVGFMGFPIGAVLGLSPVTHRGIISAITPVALPGGNARQLNEAAIRRLKSGAFEVYQLDATAYPGNSGGPLFDPESGNVIGILNMVFVKASKEAVLSQPSGISFAIPIRYLNGLLKDLS
ncbi:S1C family serine protease [Chitinimonas sp. BJB300]|uniref:S1C family serine protease n=1 Tax=Chitinimonas sp. BJB300 TaxID=1559339 RepID=UPI000C0CF06A|nr:serine protease [Chitinimonas sp. BJB300]PHV13363.1 serine protease [Chitinimonas sp. BJB300]TSJ85279.1 trypsin-like peptidase domain-containing protein [Chitinimonas sp. BJB300]